MTVLVTGNPLGIDQNYNASNDLDSRAHDFTKNMCVVKEGLSKKLLFNQNFLFGSEMRFCSVLS